MVDVRVRHREPELMDEPGLDPARHSAALQGLARLNRWSGSAWALWQPLRMLARRVAPEPLRVLDVATGAGDVPIQLTRFAQRAGLRLVFDACDVSPHAIRYAESRASVAAAPVRFFQLDALTDPLHGTYDVIINSLFLHHLEQPQAVDLLRRMAAAARRLVLANDLVRSAWSYRMVALGAHVLTRSDVVHTDSLRSVRAAYSIDEARGLAQEAGLTGAEVAFRWPCRFLLSWAKA